jgi:heme exporter protein C
MEKKNSLAIDVIGWLTFVTVLISLFAIFMYVPTEKEMGVVQRIFYFHVPSAWVAFLAFFVVFVNSILYLWKKDRRWDIAAHSSAEIGVLFCTLVLLTGPIWGKAAWGTWWTWEPRLTTTLVLWFIYIAYLMLRTTSLEPTRQARFSAVLGIIGFIDVPIVFMAIRWWRTIHPIVFNMSGSGLESSMLQALLISLAAFTFLYLLLFFLRINVEKMKDEVEVIKQGLDY